VLISYATAIVEILLLLVSFPWNAAVRLPRCCVLCWLGISTNQEGTEGESTRHGV